MWYNWANFVFVMSRYSHQWQHSGFTLVELVVVVAITVALASLTIPLYVNFQATQQAASAAEEIVQLLREAQARAMAGDGAMPWGVYFEDDLVGADDRFILFRGASFAARNPSFDFATDLADTLSFGSISFTGGSAVVFTRSNGTTANVGSLVVSASNGDAVTVRVNAAGAVDLE